MSGSVSFEDLKKVYATSRNSTESADSVIELCYSGRKVMVKPLKVGDKKNLLKAIEGKKQEVIDKIIDDILERYVEPTDGGKFDVEDLVSQERRQVMVYIRIAAGGDIAKVFHVCPKCEHINRDIEYDMNEMNVVPVNKDISNEVKLTDQIKAIVGPVSRKDEKVVERFNRKNKHDTATEKSYAMLAACIKNVYILNDSGEFDEVSFTGYEQIYDFFVNVLNDTHLPLITDKIKEMKFGVEMPFDFTCTECGFTSNEEVSVDAFFIS